MCNTPQQTLELTGPAANRHDDPEIKAIEDFHIVTLQHQPNRLIAIVGSPSSPGEVEDYHNSILYLDQLGFLKLNA